jgi:hypothetical protein
MGKVLRRPTSILGLVALVLCFAWQAFSAEVKKPEPPKPAYDMGGFSYKSEGRRDPFEALHVVRLRQDKSAKALKKGYELEELKAVGIVKTEKTRLVLMEDMQGKGLLFKKGDQINPNLWVTDVLDGKVALAYRLKGETRQITMDVPRK